MPQSSFVCAHAPMEPSAVGAVLSESPRKQNSIARSGVFLPIEPELLTRLPLGGFVRRSWGPGWVFNLNRAEGGSPIAIQVRAGDSRLHWAAEVSRVGTAVGRGKLQIAMVRGATGVLSPGFSQVIMPEPFQLEPAQPLVLRGTVQLNTLLEGFVALQLWGVCSGIVVNWIAVSQAGASE